MSEKKEFVDKLITAVPGEWEFNKEVTQSFDDHVRKSVPLYDEIQRMVIEMSEWFVRDGSVIYDLGSSTGETISLLLKKHSGKKNVKFIGIENSISMIEAAKKKCNTKNVQFLHQDITQTAEFPNADFITALYTFQFLPLKNRIKVLQRIYNDLSEGGVFVMVEKIRAENSFLEDMWMELYWDFKRNQGLTDNMILQKARSLRGVLFPLTLTENMNILKQVGFSNIDTFVKWYNFAGIIALKSRKSNVDTRDKQIDAIKEHVNAKRNEQ